MRWPTPHEWLAGLHRAKSVLALLWVVAVVALAIIWYAFDATLAGLLIAAGSLVAVVIAAALELTSDTIKGRIALRELAEYGRKSCMAVRRGFPRIEKHKPEEDYNGKR